MSTEVLNVLEKNLSEMHQQAVPGFDSDLTVYF